MFSPAHVMPFLQGGGDSVPLQDAKVEGFLQPIAETFYCGVSVQGSACSEDQAFMGGDVRVQVIPIHFEGFNLL